MKKRFFATVIIAVLFVASLSAVVLATPIEWAIEPTFMEVRSFSEGLAGVRTGEPGTPTWGFINMDGEMVIEPQFYGVGYFSEGFAFVQVEEHSSPQSVESVWQSGNVTRTAWGVIDAEGSIVIPPNFFASDVASVFSEGLAPVGLLVAGEEIWGFINTSGNFIIEPQFYSAGRFSEGMAAVSTAPSGNTLIGFIDTYGDFVITPQFEQFQAAGWNYFNNGHAMIMGGLLESHFFIDAMGNVVVSYDDFLDGESFYHGLSVNRLFDGSHRVLDVYGNIVFETDTADQLIVVGHNILMTFTGFGYRRQAEYFIDISGESPVFSAANFPGRPTVLGPSKGMWAVECDLDTWGFVAIESVIGGLSSQPSTSEVSLPPIDEEASGFDAHTLRFAIGESTYSDNGAQHTMEAPPFVSPQGRTMVPLRIISEALGAEDLDFTDGVITFTIGSQSFTMTIGEDLSPTMGAPVIVNGRTFVPIAFVVDRLNATARWDSDARAAYVYID